MPRDAVHLHDVPDLCRMGLAALTAGFASGRLSPVEVARAALDRAAAIQPSLNAFTLLDVEGANGQARASEARWRAGAPLSAIDGVPTTLKDIVHVAGWSVRYGSATTDAAPMAADAPSVARLRAAGAVFIGQTTTPEFGWKAVTDSPSFDITRNPHDPGLTPGGSSGGAAVAAACGAGVLHLGTDGGGSIRIPAAFTGTFGIKPSFGRVPADPPSVFGTVAHIGPMTRAVADARAMLAVMGGHDPRDWHQPWGAMSDIAARPFDWAGKRVAVWREPPVGRTDPALAGAFDKALARLTAAGARLNSFTLPAGAALLDVFHAHWLTGAANRLGMIPEGERTATDPGFAEAAAQGARFTVTDMVQAQLARFRFGVAMERVFETHDLIVSPACAVLPFAAGAEVPPGSGLTRWTEWAGFSWPINLSQQPACALPAGKAQGLPAGFQIIGPRGADGLVLDAAEAAEILFADLD